MKIPGKKIADFFIRVLKKSIKKNKKPTLAVILADNNPQQLSFVKSKEKVAKKIGINFILHHFKSAPSFEQFLCFIKKISSDKNIHGIVIQQPLPSKLMTQSLYTYIPKEKEIEGHHPKSPFLPPIGQAVLIILKYVFISKKIDKNLFIDLKKDLYVFKEIFRRKKVVLIGKGLTGGKPIGETLSKAKINYINIHSKTPNPQEYYKEADVIISAVGKKILTPEVLKPGVVLINIGLHKEGERLKGDYEEKEIEKIASYYTPIIGGTGILDVVCLYKNLIDGFKIFTLPE